MRYDIYNCQAEKVKEIKLNPDIFEVKINQGLVHQAAVAQISSSRKVLAHAKDKSEVRGGGKKPWRQKGTGRARHGSTRSPIWVGGGATFGPTKDRNFTKKINKKMKRKALFMCLTDRAAEQDMVLLDKFEVKDNKTKEFIKLLNNLKKLLKPKKDKPASVLFVAGKNTAQVSRIAKNIPGIKVTGANSLNVVDILAYKNLIITQDSLEVIDKVYGSTI